MARGVARQRDERHARRDFAARNGPEPVVIGVEGGPGRFEEGLRALARGAHDGIVAPEFELGLVDHHLGLGEHGLAVQREAADVVGVAVADQDRVDVGGRDACRVQRHGEAAAPAVEATRSRVDQDRAAAALDHVARDGEVGERRPMRGPQHGGRLLAGDALEEVEASIEEAVAQVGHDDVAHLAAVHRRGLGHGFGHEIILFDGRRGGSQAAEWAQLFRNSSSAAFTTSVWVVHMPCAPPGITFSLAPLTILAESSPESAIGTI